MKVQMNLPINTIVAKEFDLRGAFRFHEEFAVAVELLKFSFLKLIGGALLMSGDAAAAEKVFREDLDHNPRS